MLRRILIFTSIVAIAAVAMVGVWGLRYTHIGEIEVNNINKFDKESSNNDKSYLLSISPCGDKKIVYTNNKELVLLVKSGNKETSKVIYKNYSLLSDDPYSMYNFEKYNIQWSQNEKYVFVRDSIYDIGSDKLNEIKNNVAFMWVGNKGICMDNGYYYTMGFDDGYSNYMAISKKIDVFDAGNIRTLACAEEGRYFVRDNINLDNIFDIKDDCLVINTASLKYKAEELQKVINEGYGKMIKAIYKKRKIGRFEYPENVIANGSYYLKNVRSIKLRID